MQIKAEIAADSINPFGHRITTLLVTFPRYILAELNTHRVLSKNSASSRAIPFRKMVESVIGNPFIPYAWQEDHKGMQGTHYLDDKPASYLTENRDGKIFFDYQKFRPDVPAKEILEGIWAKGGPFERPSGTALDCVINIASELNNYGVTKQLANRLLEPFMWHTVLVTGTEWDNFFNLRCPQYYYEPENLYFKSRKDFTKYWNHNFSETMAEGTLSTWTTLDWLKINKGQADIHMMFLAEAIWDAMNESKPRELKAGDWHIPWESKIIGTLADIRSDNHSVSDEWKKDKIRVATGMAARASYTVVGEEKEISWTTLAGIHDKMLLTKDTTFHASPFEHCAEGMSEEDLDMFIRMEDGSVSEGWCRNFKGWKQYRWFIENNINL